MIFKLPFHILAAVMLLFFTPKLVALDDSQDNVGSLGESAVITRLSSVSFLKGDFTQSKTLTGMSYPLKAAGRFMLWKNHGLHLATIKPFFNAQTILQSETLFWKEDGALHAVSQSNSLVQKEINKTLLAFMQADIDMIKKRFFEAWDFNDNVWVLTLTPKLSIVRDNIALVKITGKDFIESLEVTSANRDVTRMVFSRAISTEEPSQEECLWFFKANDSLCGSLSAGNE